MGSIRKSPTAGRWQARFRDPSGRQRTATFPSKGAARAYLSAVEADVRRGVWRDPELDTVTFAEWHDRWWPTVERSDRARNTVVQYESLVRRHVLPHLGELRLAEVRRIDLEEWLGELRSAGLSTSTVRTCRTLAGMVLASAVDSEIIRSNPLAGVRLVQKAGPSRARRALTVEQVERLADAAADVGYREVVLVMGYGGLRPSETFGLRRRHLDDFGQLVVEGGMVEVRGRLVETDGKTHRPRVVPLPESVLEAVTDHIRRQRISDPQALLFTTPAGRPIGLRNFRRTLARAADTAGLPDWFSPYCLRHTCASLLAQRGVPVTTAAALMGHDPAMFLRTYAHLYPGDLRSAAAALDSARTTPGAAPATPIGGHDSAGAR